MEIKVLRKVIANLKINFRYSSGEVPKAKERFANEASRLTQLFKMYPVIGCEKQLLETGEIIFISNPCIIPCVVRKKIIQPYDV